MADGTEPTTEGERQGGPSPSGGSTVATLRARIVELTGEERAAAIVAVLARSDDAPVSLDDLEALADTLHAGGDADAAAWVCSIRGDDLLRSARVDEGFAALRRALDLGGDDFPLASKHLVRLAVSEQRTGALRAAVRTTRSAYARAMATGAHGEALGAVAYLSIYSFQLGHLHRAVALTDRLLAGEAELTAQANHSNQANHSDQAAQAAQADQADQANHADQAAPHRRADGGVVMPDAIPPQLRAAGRITRAMVCALQGSWHESARWFDEAEEIVRQECPWFSWMVRTYRGVALGRFEAPMDDAVLAEMEAATPEAAGTEIAWRFAYATGVALVGHGQVDAGIARLEQALATVESAWDRACIGLCLGEALLGAGRPDDAAVRLTAALAAFEAMDASYWMARTHVALARAEPDRADLHLAVARSYDDGDPAYTRLFDLPERLSIDVGASPSVRLGDVVVEFPGRQAEFTVYALAVAGPDGVPLQDLVAVLWPSPDPQKIPQRVRTLLWQVRRALGADGWRLVRDGDRVRLDLRGVEVVGLVADELLTAVGVGDGATPDHDGAARSHGGADDGAHVLPTWGHLGGDANAWVRSLLS